MMLYTLKYYAAVKNDGEPTGSWGVGAGVCWGPWRPPG